MRAFARPPVATRPVLAAVKSHPIVCRAQEKTNVAEAKAMSDADIDARVQELSKEVMIMRLKMRMMEKVRIAPVMNVRTSLWR
jgi:ribosomal protein L29